MKTLLVLALRSAWNRRLTLSFTIAAIALAVTLLLGIERLRQEARESFSQSVSGVDLVVGPRGAPIQLLLYAVFRMGESTQNLSWQSVQMLAENPEVAWMIPLSLGDSHHGFPVVATNAEYFKHFRYGERQPLSFSQGCAFEGLFDAVLGADVAENLGYHISDRLTLSHGTGEIALAEHADKPFQVVGILKRTGTPVDRSVHISLEAMEAIHLDWQGGAPMPGVSIPAEYVGKFDLRPKEVTAVLVGLKSRAAVFKVQRSLNGYTAEPLMAVLPGVALDQLWQMLDVVERVLRAISMLVMVVGVASLIAVILAGLNERRRELAVLRSVGARPFDIFMLLATEGFLLTLIGACVGVALLNVLMLAAAPFVEAYYGLTLHLSLPKGEEWALLGALIAVGALASLLPGYRAYRLSLADGLNPRI